MMHLLTSAPNEIKFAFVLMWITLCCAIIAVIIMPIIFNFFVIPKIEKKIGYKLKIRPIYGSFLFGNFTYRYIDIVGYLAYKYLALKFKSDQDAIKMNKEYGLGEFNYRLEDASRFELIMTLLACINFFISVVSIILMFCIVAIYKETHK